MLTPPVECVSARYHLFSTPALGPARMIQASAVSSPGVTTEPKTSTRMRPRTDMPWRGLMRVLVFGSVVTPGLLTALAWIILAGPNAGVLNKWYRALTHSTGGVNIFTLPGVNFVAVLECYPFAFLLISGALTLVSADMEDAA